MWTPPCLTIASDNKSASGPTIERCCSASSRQPTFLWSIISFPLPIASKTSCSFVSQPKGVPMGWRFRHSFKIIPGVRLNLSKSGLSASIGAAPFTVNVGPRGVYGTASLPGTGISYRQQLGGSAPHQPDVSPSRSPATPSFPSIVSPPTLPAVPSLVSTPALPIQEVHSASTELLTSESLKEIKRVLQTTYEEHEDISRQLTAARQEKETDRKSVV